MIELRPPSLGLSRAVEPILRALPEWFGIEEATQMYIDAANDNPTIVAIDTLHGNLHVGFLTLMNHSPHAAEIYAMGVLPDYHRQGVGQALVDTAEQYLRARGVTYLQVKTLSDKHPDEGYAKTRAFYSAMGFCLLEEFPDIWGPANPCWQMVKTV